MAKTLVAYFSASGVTEGVAKKISEAAGADLFEIKPAVPYTNADLNWMDRSSRSTMEMNDKSSRVEIAETLDNMEDYDTVMVGYPVWWYTAPHIINSFLESYDLSGKTIIPFCTSGSSGIGDAQQYLKDSAKGAHIKEGRRFKASVSKDEIDKWLNR